MTVFASGGDARTFDFQVGGVGFVPFAMGYCIQNTGTTRLHYLEMFNAPVYPDSSPAQWLALTPPELARAHLNVDNAFNRSKQLVVGQAASAPLARLRLSTRNRWIGRQPYV